MRPPGSPIRTREALTAVAIAMAVMTAGLVEMGPWSWWSLRATLVWLFFLLLLGAAVGVARWSPEAALVLAWTTGLVQVVAGMPPLLLTELSLLFVLFAAARWGRATTVVVAGLTGLLVPLAALAWVRSVGVSPSLWPDLIFDVLGLNTSARDGRMLLLGLAVVGFPYLAGLVLRFFARARTAQAAQETAEREAQQAQEIARLQEAQNRLARDVHDVVGHSLTVILAQAESAQYLDDPDRLKRTMQTIATSARTSLQDVRQVLTPGQTATPRQGGLDTLIESVRASGHPVVATETGAARPLPPELDAVAYRVLQELLTNAIKHGRRDQPVLVQRQWPAADATGDSLRIVVQNSIDVSAEPASGGQGLVGIARRLESVGGRFEAHRRDEPPEPIFIATAVVPLRAPSGGGPA